MEACGSIEGHSRVSSWVGQMGLTVSHDHRCHNVAPWLSWRATAPAKFGYAPFVPQENLVRAA